MAGVDDLVISSVAKGPTTREVVRLTFDLNAPTIEPKVPETSTFT